jgi:hypothetical protein
MSSAVFAGRRPAAGLAAAAPSVAQGAGLDRARFASAGERAGNANEPAYFPIRF